MAVYYRSHSRYRGARWKTTSEYRPPNLNGRVALVAGATRGVGRGIALAFGEAGATVYCTGRSTAANRLARKANEKISPFDHARRPETIDETAAMVTARGGKGIAVVVDHTDPAQVKSLVDRIRTEQGKLHILVNGISELRMPTSENSSGSSTLGAAWKIWTTSSTPTSPPAIFPRR